MENFTDGNLEIITEKIDDKSIISWKGASVGKNLSDLLDAYLDAILGEIIGTVVTLRFDNLEYMNTSAVHPVIRFLKKLNDYDVITQVVYDQNSIWQAALFKELKMISSILHHVSIK